MLQDTLNRHEPGRATARAVCAGHSVGWTMPAVGARVTPRVQTDVTCVRRFQAGDSQAALALVIGIRTDEYGIPFGPEEQADLRDVPRHYLTGNGGFWVAVAGDQLVGTVGLADLSGSQGAIRRLYVASTWRGRDFGIGRTLFDGAIAHARDAGFSDICFSSSMHLTRAHAFYDKHGCARTTRDALPPGFPIPDGPELFFRIDLQQRAARS